MTMKELLNQFVEQIIMDTDYTDEDFIYLYNQVLGLVGGIDGVFIKDIFLDDFTTLDILDQLIEIAAANDVLSKRQINADMLGAQLMNFFVPRPSIIRKNFWLNYKISPRHATDYFFGISKRSNYIKTREINQNISFPVLTDYGTLQITINLSKPEKDPKKIAAALKNQNAQDEKYPVSQLAKENEGYWGRLDYPARTNHRVIPLSLGDETWYFQYSPYAYFNEHAIVFSKELRPMHVDKGNLSRLLEFVTKFPDYFIGSNADLPIVGGSILSHDHFQAGRYELPMAQATFSKEIKIKGHRLKKAGVLNWPMTTIRLVDENQDRILEAATKIMLSWEEYSDESCSIKAYDKQGERHHTVTPIVRLRQGCYEVDLVLRDNNTSTEFPDGIFHPHPDVQHIKRENIGLIEVMGLAILPPRLKKELADVKQYLLDGITAIQPSHKDWAEELNRQNEITPDNIDTIINQSVGNIFKRVLEDAGVFKRDADGQAGLQRFIDKLS